MVPKLSAKLRELHNLPDNWEVYAFERLPRDEKILTHVQLTGAESRPLKSGPRKGKLCWPNHGKNGKRTFLFTNAEYEALVEDA